LLKSKCTYNKFNSFRNKREAEISDRSDNSGSMSSVMDIPRESESEFETEYVYEKSEVIEIEIPDSDPGEILDISYLNKKNIGNYSSLEIYEIIPSGNEGII